MVLVEQLPGASHPTMVVHTPPCVQYPTLKEGMARVPAATIES
jgi:hypothetical protein